MPLAQLIEEYLAGPKVLRQAVAGMTREQLLARPIAGKWSTLEVVCHLADFDPILADRMKRVIAEDNPTLIGYDENKFATNLFMDEQSAEDAVKITSLNRQNFARVLRKLPDSAFARAGMHNERGRTTLLDLLKTYTNHLDHHLSFIHAKRAAMGKEMW